MVYVNNEKIFNYLLGKTKNKNKALTNLKRKIISNNIILSNEHILNENIQFKKRKVLNILQLKAPNSFNNKYILQEYDVNNSIWDKATTTCNNDFLFVAEEVFEMRENIVVVENCPKTYYKSRRRISKFFESYVNNYSSLYIVCLEREIEKNIKEDSELIVVDFKKIIEDTKNTSTKTSRTEQEVRVYAKKITSYNNENMDMQLEDCIVNIEEFKKYKYIIIDYKNNVDYKKMLGFVQTKENVKEFVDIYKDILFIKEWNIIKLFKTIKNNIEEKQSLYMCGETYSSTLTFKKLKAFVAEKGTLFNISDLKNKTVDRHRYKISDEMIDMYKIFKITNRSYYSFNFIHNIRTELEIDGFNLFLDFLEKIGVVKNKQNILQLKENKDFTSLTSEFANLKTILDDDYNLYNNLRYIILFYSDFKYILERIFTTIDEEQISKILNSYKIDVEKYLHQ